MGATDLVLRSEGARFPRVGVGFAFCLVAERPIATANDRLQAALRSSEPLELHLEGLQLGGVPEVLVVLCLNPVLSGEADLRQNRLYFVLCVHEYIVL